MSGALEGTRVMEVASYVTGPYAGMLLADLGAEVIKVENRPQGDPFRGWGKEGYSATFCSLNRNKKSITLNLKATEGRDIFLRLAEKADVVIENFRPGVVRNLGIHYEAVQPRNSRIVYCSISGYGQEGPYSEWPGYDTVGQAMGGLLSLITDMKDPEPVGISLADHITGIFACYGVLAALQGRVRTGQGQKVETSLLQSMVSFVQENAARYFETGVVPRRKTRVQNAGVYAFVAGDGLPFVVHLSSPPKFWQGLTEAVGKPELQEDPRFRDREGRSKNYDALKNVFSEAFATAPRQEWIHRLRENDVPCGPMYTLEEVFKDPQVQGMGVPIELKRPGMESVKVTGNPVNFSGTPVSYALNPPLLGEHNAEVLKTLGYGAKDVERLSKSGVI
jgi:crotonobetainyl-CoA:carnitine CoA-transferase CaiB-like acyl-CoA transferase